MHYLPTYINARMCARTHTHARARAQTHIHTYILLKLQIKHEVMYTQLFGTVCTCFAFFVSGIKELSVANVVSHCIKLSAWIQFLHCVRVRHLTCKGRT